MQPDYQQKTSRFKSPRFWVITIITVSIILSSVGIGLYVYRSLTTPNCLDTEDYRAFYGNDPVDVSLQPGSEFFRGTYAFTPNTMYLNEADLGANLDEDISNLATFYRERSRKPMVFVIEAFYSPDSADSKSIAEQRATGTQRLLTDAGIAVGSIEIKLEPTTTVVDEDSDGYDATNTATLSLKSADSCRE